jgi:hypothetical protein
VPLIVHIVGALAGSRRWRPEQSRGAPSVPELLAVTAGRTSCWFGASAACRFEVIESATLQCHVEILRSRAIQCVGTEPRVARATGDAGSAPLFR